MHSTQNNGNNELDKWKKFRGLWTLVEAPKIPVISSTYLIRALKLMQVY